MAHKTKMPTEAWGTRKSSEEDTSFVGPVMTPQRRVSYEELEDRYFKVVDENKALKEKLKEQDKRIKELHARFMRLQRDLVRRDDGGGGGGGGASSRGARRDVEAEHMIEDLQSKVNQMSQENEKLKRKVFYYKTVIPRGALPSTKRSSSSSRKRPSSARPADRMPETRSTTTSHVASGSKENEADAKLVDFLRIQLVESKKMIDTLEKENTSLRETQLGGSFVRPRSGRKGHRGGQASDGERDYDDEMNVDDARLLKRELREKTAQLTLERNRAEEKEASLLGLKEAHAAMMEELQRTKRALQEERVEKHQLEESVQTLKIQNQRIKDLELLYEDIQKEKQALQNQNEKLLESAFSDEYAHGGHRQRERELRDALDASESKLRQMETELVALQESSSGQRQQHDEAAAQLSEYRDKITGLEQALAERDKEIQGLRDNLSIFSAESGIEKEEFLRILGSIRRRKEAQKNTSIDFLGETDEITMAELEAHNAQLITEMESMQKNLTYLTDQNRKLEEQLRVVERECDVQVKEAKVKQESAEQMLQVQADRMEQLEEMLRNRVLAQPSAFGATKSGRGFAEEATDVIIDEGQNVIDFIIHGATLDPSYLGGDLVTTFVAVDFFEHETQATPVCGGKRPQYDFTCRYAVDETLKLNYYMRSTKVPCELYRALGVNYQLIGKAMVSLEPLLQGRTQHTTLERIFSVGKDRVAIGTLEVTMSLQIPLDLRRINIPKALITTEIRQRDDWRPRTDDITQEVTVSVLGCNNLKMPSSIRQPALYVSYKFSNFSEYETDVIDGSTQPVFEDHQVFPVTKSARFTAYMEKESLCFNLTHIKRTTKELIRIGSAFVSLRPLLESEIIDGLFEIVDEQSNTIGEMRLKMTLIDSKQKKDDEIVTAAIFKADKSLPSKSVEKDDESEHDEEVEEDGEGEGEGDTQKEEIEENVPVEPLGTAKKAVKEEDGDDNGDGGEVDDKAKGEKEERDENDEKPSTPKESISDPDGRRLPTPEEVKKRMKEMEQQIEKNAEDSAKKKEGDSKEIGETEQHERSSPMPHSSPPASSVKWSSPSGKGKHGPKRRLFDDSGSGAEQSAEGQKDDGRSVAPRKEPDSSKKEEEDDKTIAQAAIEEEREEILKNIELDQFIVCGVNRVEFRDVGDKKWKDCRVEVVMHDRTGDGSNLFEVDSTMMKTPAVETANGIAKFGHTRVIAAEPDSRSRFRLERMIKYSPSDMHLSDVLFDVFVIERAEKEAGEGKRVLLGSAKMNIQKIVEKEEDPVNDIVPVLNGIGEIIAEITATLRVISVIGSIRHEDDLERSREEEEEPDDS
eukprot:TRINITY_DN2787_c0_g1_i1.p1 TRINITY_DN2787_c0_g1~~TRINITY_DN2787_c0_g1_i1.p1  ORF type:complete len:1350 (-),score=502.80 TRINITY_DN2787_c0_g1_i1:69-4022(-)